MARSNIFLALNLGLALGAARQAHAWDLGVDYGIETVTLGEFYTGAAGSASTRNTPAFAINMPITRYSLTDYSGELAAGISNLNNSLAAQAGAKMDAEADAQRQIDNGASYAVGHGSRTFELAQPVEGRTVISYATGTSTDGTFIGASGTGKLIQAKALEIEYLRNVASGEWESLYGMNYAVDISSQYRSYDMSYTQVTPTSPGGALRNDNRQMLGMPLGFTLAHGLGLEGLQAEVYGDFDILAGLCYLGKFSGLAYGYGTRVNYKTFGFLSLFAGYDVRAYTKSSVTANDDGSARIEGPQQFAGWRAGGSIDIGYLFNKLFTEVE